MSNSNYKIMFCLPGKNYSGTFLINWSNLLKHCENRRYEYYIAQAYTSNVHFVRSMCLGASILNGEDQLPFNGRIDYTHLMWIDSDIIFDSQQFEQLLSQNKNIIADLGAPNDFGAQCYDSFVSHRKVQKDFLSQNINDFDGEADVTDLSEDIKEIFAALQPTSKFEVN